MVSHQALVSFQLLRAPQRSIQVPPPPPSLLLADTPDLAQRQHLVQCGVTQATRPATNQNTQQDSLTSHIFAAVSRVTHRCQTFLGRLVRLCCAESSHESVRSLRVQFILVPSPTFRHEPPVQLLPQCFSTVTPRRNTTTRATITLFFLSVVFRINS